MKRIIAFLLISCSALADDTIPFKTSDGKAKTSTSGIGTAAKPYDFTNVNVIGIGGGGGSPGGLTGQLQYKSGAAAFGGIPSLTYDGGTVILTLAAGTKFNIVDPVDATKKLRLTLSGITSGATRVFTIPNADFVGVIPTTATTNQFLTSINSGGTQVKAQVTDANISLSDITTGNVNALRHGFAPKSPGDATQFLNGVGGYTVPAGGGGAPGGIATQFQYNNAGAFAGSANLTLVSSQVKAVAPNFLFTDISDATKQMNFSLAGITTGTTKTVIVPNVANPVIVAPDSGAANNFLTSIGASGLITKSQPAFTNISGTIATSQQNIPVGKTLYVDSVIGSNVTAVTNRFDKPYLTLNGASGAIADAAAGDNISLGPGNFIETGAIVLPQNVSLSGSGAGITTITTTGGIKPGTGDKLSDFTIDARTGSNASFNFAIGADTADTAFTDVTISGVQLLGNTDGFYFNKAGIDGIAIYDCSVVTTFDTVFMGGITGTVNFFNCDFSADGSIGGAGITSGVNAANGGTINLYGGTINLSNGVLEARGIRASAGTVNAHNVIFNVLATTKYDLYETVVGTVSNDGNVRADRTALQTSGTITQVKNTYEGNLGLTDITTANATTSAHGFVKKLPNNAALYYDGTGNYSSPSGAGVTAGSGIDITSNVVSVDSSVITDQATDAAVTQDDFLLTYDTTLDQLMKVSLASLAAHLEIVSIVDGTTGFGSIFNTSSLTGNNNIWIPDANNTLVVGAARGSGQVVTGITAHGDVGFGYPDSSVVTQFTANQNNFAPPTPTYYLYMSTDGTRTLTGLAGSGGNGETHIITCTSNSLVIAHENSGSTAANRFRNSNGVDFTLAAWQSAYIYYNTSANEWVAVKLGNLPAGSTQEMQFNNAGVFGSVPYLRYNTTKVFQTAGTRLEFQDSADVTKTMTLDLSGITTGNNRTFNIADAANSVSVIGGSAVSNQFVTTITSAGVQNRVQPQISNLSDAGTLATWAGITPASGIAAFLTTPGSANLAAAVTNETGTGALTFANTPTLITPNISTGFTVGGAAASRKMIVGDGTNFSPSTETWAVPGTNGNVLTSDGTNWTSAAPASGFSNPMTTLGDIIYENVTPAAARLAGSTSATKNFLTQTGNGTISAAPAWGTIASGDVPTLNQNTTGSAASLSVSGQTGLMTVTGLASTNRAKTVRDAADTILELGGSYTPSGTWTNMTLVTPALGTPSALVGTNISGTGASFTAGNATKWTTGRTVATTGDVTYTSGSLDGSGNVTGTATVANVPATATHAVDNTTVPNNTGGWADYWVTGSDTTLTSTTQAAFAAPLVSGTLSNATLYEVELNLYVSSDTAAGLKVAMHGNGTGTAAISEVIVSGTTTASAANQSTLGIDSLSGTFCTASNAGNISGKGFFKTMSTGTATIEVQGAKVTSGTFTLKVGSVLRVRKAHL